MTASPRRRYALLPPLALSLVVAGSLTCADASDDTLQEARLEGKALKSAVKESIDRGLRFLRQSYDIEAGAWTVQGHPDPGITALALSSFLSSPRGYTADDGPFISKPLEYLASLAKDDGGIYANMVPNYVTAAAVMALRDSGDPKYQPLLKNAQRFLVNIQSDEQEGYSETDRFYGGAGYGGDERPDLSNMNFWMDSLAATGLDKEHDAFKKAMVFLDRCQNNSETNKGEWKNVKSGEVFVSGNDGGAAYYPGDSPAGTITLADGRKVARSYGSMTYALLKCYLLAGVPKDDPRVKAAVKWIGANYTVDENPGFDLSRDPNAGQQGLFYYYLTMAKALDQYGETMLERPKGDPVAWAEDLSRKLISIQNEDGSWVNSNPRWWENLPVLATCYSILALEHCYANL